MFLVPNRHVTRSGYNRRVHFPEAAVVHKLKQHLVANGMRGAASNIVVDAHATNTRSKYSKKLEPFARIGDAKR